MYKAYLLVIVFFIVGCENSNNSKSTQRELEPPKAPTSKYMPPSPPSLEEK